MKAIILCAGLGTRLRPVTERWPKPLLPVLGQPLFRYTLEVLQRAGIDGVGINTHHLPEKMEAVARAECERAGLRLTVSREPIIQGTAGGIRGLRRLVEGERAVVVFNGDILFGLELAPVLREHLASGAAATMVLLPMPVGERYAAVETDEGGDVRAIAGFGPGGPGLRPWHFASVHVLSPEVFEAMTPSGEEDINRQVYPRLLARGARIRGHVLDPEAIYWADLGTPARYLATHRDLLRGGPRVASLQLAAAPRLAVIAPSAVLEPEVTIGEGVVINAGARVGRGASLVDALVLEDAVVPAGARLERCVVFCPSPGLPSVVLPAA